MSDPREIRGKRKLRPIGGWVLAEPREQRLAGEQLPLPIAPLCPPATIASRDGYEPQSLADRAAAPRPLALKAAADPVDDSTPEAARG